MTDIKGKLVVSEVINGLQIEQLDEIILEAQKRKKELGNKKVEFDEYKIYAFIGRDNDIYKLHNICDNGEHAFIELSSSCCWANGSGEAEEMIEKVGDSLHVFDSQNTFIKWCAEKEGLI